MDYRFEIGDLVLWKDRLWVIKNRDICTEEPIYELKPWRPIHVFEKDLKPIGKKRIKQ